MESNWINITERLPKNLQRVLVGFYYLERTGDMYKRTKCVDIFTSSGNGWVDSCNEWYSGRECSMGDIEVVCWMEIPNFD